MALVITMSVTNWVYLFGGRPIFFNDRKKLSQFGHHARKRRIVNTASVSFTVILLWEKWPKCLRWARGLWLCDRGRYKNHHGRIKIIVYISLQLDFSEKAKCDT